MSLNLGLYFLMRITNRLNIINIHNLMASKCTIFKSDVETQTKSV